MDMRTHPLVIDDNGLLDMSVSVELIFEIDVSCSDGKTEASEDV